MHIARVVPGVLAGVLFTSAPVAGAQTVYRWGSDTLRFQDVTRTEIRLTTPQGEIPMRAEHDATIAVTRSPAGIARAWYESLILGMTTPGGTQRPETGAVLHEPFSLRLDSRGRTSAITAPAFPASFEAVTDLSHQFDDFFMRLPARRLRVGLTWRDSLIRTDSSADKVTRWHSNATYRVQRDTVVDGVPALVISMRQVLRSYSDAPIPGQSTRAQTNMRGTEEGYFVFAPRIGRLLARRREGQLAGDLVMRGSQGDLAFQQSFTYTNAIDALR